MDDGFRSTSVVALAKQSLPTLAEAAARAVREASTFDERKEIGAKLEAILAYQRRARASREAMNAIAELRLWNERFMGEMIAGIEWSKGGRPGKTSSLGDGFSHADLGITRKQGAIYEALADIPDATFTTALEDARTAEEPLTAKLLLRAFRATQKHEENEVLRRHGAIVPEGTFETIVIDPPWDMKKVERDVRPNQVGFDYPTMSQDKLKAFTIPAAPDSHMFCWTTQKFLPPALELVEHWGFRYVLLMVWHKPGGFQPIGLPQYNCEFVVYARKGSPTFVDTTDFFCCFSAPRREHSRKPDELYDVIRRVTPGPRIDIFSREPREGFAQLGNEVEKFGGAEAA